MLKKLFGNSLIYAIGPQLPKIVSIFLLPLYTQKLTELDYGFLGLYTMYLGLIGGVRDLGFSQPMVNVFFKYPKKWKIIWASFYGFLFLYTIPFALLQSIVLFIAFYYKIGLSNTIIIILLQIINLFVFDLPIKFGSYYFQLSAKPLPIAIVSAISGIITIVFQYYFIVVLNLRFMAFIYSLFISSAVTFLYYFYFTMFRLKLYPIFKIYKTLIKHYLKIALPTIPHNYSSYLLNTSDRLVMDVLKVPQSKIGLYSFAYNFGSYADMLGGSIGMAVSPFSLKGYSLGKEYITRNLFFLLQFIFLLGTSIFCVWIKEIFGLLVKNLNLNLTYTMAAIIIFSYVFRPLYWCVINFLGYNEKTNALWKITLIGGLINVVLNIIFIPIYGIMASCVITFFSLLYIGFAGFFLKEFKELTTVNYYPIQWLVSILLLAMITYFLIDSFWAYKLIYSFAIIIISILLIFMRRNEIKEFNSII